MRITLSLTISLLALAAVANAEPTLRYVATNGKDTNSGTISEPWRTVQHAANVVQPNTIVYLRGGVYNEQVTVNVSGSTAGRIIFESYPGESAVIDGTGIKPTSEQGLIDIENRRYVEIANLEIRNFVSSNENVPVGIYVAGSGSFIWLINNYVHNITTTLKTSSGDALGIAVYGTNQAPLSEIDIDGNTLTDLTLGFSESLGISGNVQNFTIQHNLIHDNNNIGVDIEGFEGTAPTPAVDQPRYGNIVDNTVYNITTLHNPAYGDQPQADGLYVDGGAYMTLQQNLVHNCDIGIEMASEHSGRTSSNCIARNNIVYNSNVVGVTIGGYQSSVGGTDHCTIVNNTLYNNDTEMTGTGEIQIQFYATNNLFENNIVFANAQGLMVSSITNSEPDPATFNHNLYFSSVGADNTSWVWQNNQITGTTLWVQTTGDDKQSLFDNPDFVSVTAPNFKVAANSQAIDHGDDLGSSIVGTVDYSGNPRVIDDTIDIGAYEH